MITKELLDKMENGDEVYIFTVTNEKGAYAKILNLGGILQSLYVPDKNGKLDDVICGFDSATDYLTGGGCHGALIGRYGNRIKSGKFTLNGVKYQLAKNEKGINHLHGGNKGYNARIWGAVPYEKVGEQGLILTLVSPGGDERYPGALNIKVTYTLTDNNELKIHYEAKGDKDTIINMTNHSYFNLDSFDAGSVLGHYLYVAADSICEIDENLIPTGNSYAVAGTPFDFNEPAKIGARINDDDSQLKLGGGYDHHFNFSDYDGKIKLQAELYSEKSGRVMSVYTDQPGVQIYSANMMNNPVEMKNGFKQVPRAAVCLETQHAPDSPNHPNFISTTLKAGEKYDTTTIYAFGVKESII